MPVRGKTRARKTSVKPGVGRLDEIHVPILNMARMREFYGAQLGLREAFSHEDRMVAFATGGAMLVLDSTKPRVGPAYLGFQVRGSSALIARLQSGGTKVLTQTSEQHWGELLTRVEDPEGNVLAFEEGIEPEVRAVRRHFHRVRSRTRATGVE